MRKSRSAAQILSMSTIVLQVAFMQLLFIKCGRPTFVVIVLFHNKQTKTEYRLFPK